MDFLTQLHVFSIGNNSLKQLDNVSTFQQLMAHWLAIHLWDKWGMVKLNFVLFNFLEAFREYFQPNFLAFFSQIGFFQGLISFDYLFPKNYAII